MSISTEAEYEAALHLVQDLSGSLEGTPEEKLLIRTVLDIEIWDTSNAKFSDLPEQWGQEARP